MFSNYSNSMVLLVALSEHVLKAQDTGSFLSVTFGSALIQAKRSLDKFMQAQLKSLDDFKPKNAKKLGILPFIRNFEVNHCSEIQTFKFVQLT